MSHELAIYGLGGLSVIIMLALCLDIVRRNSEIAASYKKASVQVIETAAAQQKDTPVYPIYVDCSQELLAYEPETPNTADLNVLASRPSA
ncbi:hypothetical protein [Paenibacillus piri]|uniref:Uncharacterized protein n=1 Tax=Paenibacillus piri TaxID=2547395 RepID=A0A4R5KIU0_9BACL|nr:hypothetical protein [Paenibacillus piri]TDF95032.1 hypothetical protein E1757_21070 [Paenibacillus piri]